MNTLRQSTAPIGSRSKGLFKTVVFVSAITMLVVLLLGLVMQINGLKQRLQNFRDMDGEGCTCFEKVLGEKNITEIKKKEKVRIIAGHFARVDHLKLQYYSIKKFVTDDWEFIVVNNAPTKENEHYFKGWLQIEDARNKIYETVKSFNDDRVKHVFMDEDVALDYVNKVHIKHPLAGHRCANVVQWSLDNYVFNYNEGYSLVIDGDMFFFDYTSLVRVVLENDIFIAGVLSSRDIIHEGKIKYLYNGFMLFDAERLPHKDEFNMARAYKCDVGCMTKVYFQKYPHVYHRFYSFQMWALGNEQEIRERLPNPLLRNFFLSGLENKRDAPPPYYVTPINVIHYRAGGNWNGDPKEKHVLEGQRWLKFFKLYFGCMDDNCNEFADNWSELKALVDKADFTNI